MMNEVIKMNAVYNVKLIYNGDIYENKAVIYNEKIIDIIDESDLSIYPEVEKINGFGMYLSPGFIDIHVHGCSSYDAMDDSDENLNIISKNLARTGITSFLATTMTMELSKIENSLAKIRKNMNNTEGAQILGAHLEGPFISKKYKGAQDDKYILPPDFELIEKFKDVIKIVSMAPEIDGSLDFIAKCAHNNIIVSIGHTNASYEEAMLAIEAGAKHVTHTFNAMTPLNHRLPGTIGAAMLSDVSCELIADNIHVHPAVQKLLIQIKGFRNVMLITDAMRACLMCDGKYSLGGQDVFVENNSARLKDGTLAGSILTMNTALRNILNNTDLPLHTAVEMASKNQAEMLKIADSKGSIDIGKDADMVIFDSKFNINCTIARGKIIYRS